MLQVLLKERNMADELVVLLQSAHHVHHTSLVKDKQILSIFYIKQLSLDSLFKTYAPEFTHNRCSKVLLQLASGLNNYYLLFKSPKSSVFSRRYINFFPCDCIVWQN